MYVKLSDIKFAKPEHKTTCETLYKDILNVENQLINDEEMLEYFKSVLGDKIANFVGSPTVAINKRILMALKLSFWYYSGGKLTAHVVGEEPEFNIFDP